MASIDTVNDITPRRQYVAAAAQVDFDYPFPIFEDNDLVVVVDDVTFALNTDYSVTGEGEDNGGTVTLVTPLVGGEVVTIYRDIAIARDTDFQQNGPFRAAAINNEFDKAYLIMQGLESKIGRALRLPLTAGATDAETELAPLDNWLSRYITIDSNGRPAPAAFSDVTMTQGTIGGLLYPRNAFESAALVTPTNYAIPHYGRGRYANFTDWRLACDQADAEGFLTADYAITADTYLPKKCDFRGFQITGSYYTIHQGHQAGWVKQWEASKPYIRGAFFCQYTGMRAVDILVDGLTSGYGTFWSSFQISEATSLTLLMTNFSVNFNTFYDGLCRYVHLTGNTSLFSTAEIHGNTFRNLDFSNNGLVSYGVLQDDTKRQRNFIDHCYYENGSDIEGNFHIDGWQGDSNSPPRVDRYCNLINAIGINQLNRADFPSFSVRNLVRGGCWDWLSSTGVPPGFGHFGGTSVSVQADTGEPTGAGSRWEASFASAFGRFELTLRQSGVDRAAVWVFYKSTADFVNIESNDGSGAVSHNVRPVDQGSNWKLLRLAVPVSKTSNTTVSLYAYAGTGGAAKVISLGGVFAGAGAGAIPPIKNDEYFSKAGSYASVGGEMIQHGSVAQGYVSATPTDVAITFPTPFASAPNVTFCVEGIDANTPHFTKAYVKTGSISASGFTVRVEYAVDWDGNIQWIAMGPRA